MKTKQEREAAFRAELKALLESHGAEIEITDDRKPYGMHSGVAVVTMLPVWDGDGNEVAEYTEFQL